MSSLKDLRRTLQADARNYESQQGMFHRFRRNLFIQPMSDQRYIWKYIRTMRICEYILKKQEGGGVKR